MPLEIKIIANSMIEPGMSGGNRIFIELAKKWDRMGHRITIFISPVGKRICQANDLMGVKYVTWPALKFKKLGIFIQYIIGTFWGLWNVLKARLRSKGGKNIVIWSTSDFWPDSLSGLLMRSLYRKSFWISSIFMFAPNPFSQTRKFSWQALIHFITQKPIFLISKKITQMIFVTNDGDRQFVIDGGVPPEKVVSIRGGVDFEYIKGIKALQKTYLACFMGRLHRHKGILELIDIWQEVCKVKPKAKLAVIGEGPQRKEVEDKIKSYGLEDNVTLFGFIDGDYKYIILKESSLFLHSSVWDSGGMSAAEGMACGLPVVGYDLPAFKTYYPQGMLKAPIGDPKAYAKMIIRLADDQNLYNRFKQEAEEWAKGWDWSKNAERIMIAITSLLGK